MKQVILLGARDHGEKNSVHAMQAAFEPHFRASGLSVTAVYFEDLIFVVKTNDVQIVDTRSGRTLSDADLLVAVNWYKGGDLAIYRDVAYSIALYLDQHAVPFWNREMIQQRSVGKLSAMVLFALHGIDVPQTYFSLDPAVLSKEVPGIFPVVVKDAMASRGRRNYLIGSNDELQKRLHARAAPNHYLVQESIPNDHDIRVVCFAGKPAFAMTRRRAGDDTHLNNTSLGGSAEELALQDLPQNVVDACVRICKLMGRDMTGIDVLPATDSSGRFVFLEANAVPQLTSGSLVEQKLRAMAQAIEEYLKR